MMRPAHDFRDYTGCHAELLTEHGILCHELASGPNQIGDESADYALESRRLPKRGLHALGQGPGQVPNSREYADHVAI